MFKLCLVTALLTLLIGRSVHAQEDVCDLETFWEETKLNLPAPKSSSGKCLNDCMLKANDMLGDDGLVDVDKFAQSLKETRKIPDDVIEKLSTVAEKCKSQENKNECETAALFVQCASDESVKIGFLAPDVATTIRLVYLFVAVESKGEYVPPTTPTTYESRKVNGRETDKKSDRKADKKADKKADRKSDRKADRKSSRSKKTGGRRPRS